MKLLVPVDILVRFVVWLGGAGLGVSVERGNFPCDARSRNVRKKVVGWYVSIVVTAEPLTRDRGGLARLGGSVAERRDELVSYEYIA